MKSYIARCKPLFSWKNRMARLQFAKKYLKQPEEWRQEKSEEAKRNCTWIKVLICETWCWWCYSLGHIAFYVICSSSVKCLQSHWTMLHPTARQWSQTYTSGVFLLDDVPNSLLCLGYVSKCFLFLFSQPIKTLLGNMSAWKLAERGNEK